MEAAIPINIASSKFSGLLETFVFEDQSILKRVLKIIKANKEWMLPA